jgi:hypothetical protein
MIRSVRCLTSVDKERAVVGVGACVSVSVQLVGGGGGGGGGAGGGGVDEYLDGSWGIRRIFKLMFSELRVRSGWRVGGFVASGLIRN